MSEEKTTREELKIRKLRVRDLSKIVDIFEKNIAKIGEDGIRNIISSTAQSTQTETDTEKSIEETVGKQVVEIGTAALKQVTDIWNTDITELFADLLEVEVETYLDMDIDTPIRVIELIRTAPEAEGFFMMRSLFSKMTGLLETPLNLIKERYGSIFAEARGDS